ncbi:hypothetical protein R6Q59_012195 [Mikania micrantha]
MSFSGNRRSPAVHSSTVVFIIIFFVLQVCALSSDWCRVTAIKTSSPPSPPPSAKDSGDTKRSELYKRFFNGGFTHVPKGKTFQETKRTVPSCPDRLHN